MAKISKRNKKIILSIISAIILIFITYYQDDIKIYIAKKTGSYVSYGLEEVPQYHDTSYVFINDNEPSFNEIDYNIKAESYSELDSLGRAGSAIAIVSKKTMPSEERGSIGSIKPTGWHTIKYDNIDGKYLYNRCHLIGYQLAGENANEKNLITCTREMNTGVMLEYENMIADYIKSTNNSVLYRVTPIYEKDNLVASGVTMEAISIEDNGKGIKFHIYVYNVQNGITIDYLTGDSYLNE